MSRLFNPRNGSSRGARPKPGQRLIHEPDMSARAKRRRTARRTAPTAAPAKRGFA